MVTATLKNDGNITADEVALFFVRDLVGSLTRPVKELKGFKRVTLKAGESTSVIFLITSDDLSFWTADNKWAAESGTFSVWIGPNASNGLTANFTLK